MVQPPNAQIESKQPKNLKGNAAPPNWTSFVSSGKIYNFVFKQVLTFPIGCWYSSISLKNTNRLQAVIKVCSKVAGTALTDLANLYKGRILKKAISVLVDPNHSLF